MNIGKINTFTRFFSLIKVISVKQLRFYHQQLVIPYNFEKETFSRVNSFGFSFLNRKIKKTFEILTLCFFDKRSLILKKLIQYFLSFFYLKLFLLCYGIEKLLFSDTDKKCIGSTKKYFDFVDQYASPQEAQDIIVIPRIKSRM